MLAFHLSSPRVIPSPPPVIPSVARDLHVFGAGSRVICTALSLILVRASPALSQSMEDTLQIEVAAVHAIVGRVPATDGRPRYLLNSAITQREAAPGYRVGERAPARLRRLADSLGVPYVSRDKAMVCENRSCEVQNATALVSLSEVRFSPTTGSVTVTIDRQGPDRVVNGERRRKTYYETVHYVFARDVSGWKLIQATQLGIE